MGANGHKLTVNRPKKPVINPHIRDGACPDYQNGGLEESYYPNSFGTVVDGKRKPLMTTKITSEEVKHYNSFNDDNYSQVIVAFNCKLSPIVDGMFTDCGTFFKFSC